MVGGLSGQRMLIGLLIGIIVLVVLVLKTKIHAFLALIMSAVIIGLVGGMPMVNVTLENGKTLGIINSITTGFGGTLGSIGIIIGFGVMMGQIFERRRETNGSDLFKAVWKGKRGRGAWHYRIPCIDPDLL